jgi:hypothetical protein
MLLRLPLVPVLPDPLVPAPEPDAPPDEPAPEPLPVALEPELPDPDPVPLVLDPVPLVLDPEPLVLEPLPLAPEPDELLPDPPEPLPDWPLSHPTRLTPLKAKAADANRIAVLRMRMCTLLNGLRKKECFFPGLVSTTPEFAPATTPYRRRRRVGHLYANP